MIQKILLSLSLGLILFSSCGKNDSKSLPRAKASQKLEAAFEKFVAECDRIENSENPEVVIHSVMIVQNGKVRKEYWRGKAAPDEAHILFSVSKTFTATAIGMLVDEGKLKITDKVISFFPNDLPEVVSENLSKMTIRDLLTMSCGQDKETTVNDIKGSVVKAFLASEVPYTPGEYFWYNSVGTYMLSAITQKVSGQDLVEYLYPRLFEPLGIDKPIWDKCPDGICIGGWGLYLKTEDLAKMGQLMLQNGKWNDKQLISSEWIAEASAKQVESRPATWTPEAVKEAGLSAENSDWMHGYGYQMWRGRYNSYRADGARGQYIFVFPDYDAVIAVTADSPNLQAEINLIFDTLVPAII